MRISIELRLENELINKDKNRTMLYIIKTVIENTDKELYKDMYKDHRRKNFTFSTYLGKNIKFLKDDIFIADKKIILNLSSSDITKIVRIYNSFQQYKNKTILIDENTIKISRVNKLVSRTITDREVFKTASPLCIREHNNNDNKKTYYHNYDKKGQGIFMSNLEHQINDELKEEIDIKAKLSNIKNIRVKHYDIVIDSLLCNIELEGKKEQIKHLYDNGIGSLKSAGFGMMM